MAIRLRGIVAAVFSALLILLFVILAMLSIGRTQALEFAGRLFGVTLTVAPACFAALSMVERIAFITFSCGLLLSLVALWAGLTMIRTAAMPSERYRIWIKVIGALTLAGVSVFLVWNGERVRLPRF